MYCAGAEEGALIHHSDQYRGLQYCYTRRPGGAGTTVYAEPSPDYFQYLDLGGKGMMPVGYGYRSVDFIVRAAIRIEAETEGLPAEQALARRRELLAEIDRAGVIATPSNSRFNEFVLEAGRKSILNEGREVEISYDPPCVGFREYGA